MSKGKIIVFEGLDGSGKTTQVALLRKRLKQEGIKAKLVDFPRYGQRSATLIEDYLAGKLGKVETVTAQQASILYACDRFAASAKMKKDLDEGTHLILDRYVSSNMAFQGSKLASGKQRHAFWDWNRDLEYNIFKIPKPHKTIFLHLDPKTSFRLVREREEKAGKQPDIHETLKFLKKTEKTYLELEALERGWKRIECAPTGDLLSRNEIHEMVWKAVKSLFKSA